MDSKVPWSWPSLRESHPKTLVATTVPDAIATGRLQAQQFKALLPKGGEVLYVLGDPHSTDGRDRLKGIEEVFSADPSFRISKAIGGFQEAVAEGACARWLRIALMKAHFRLDLVGSQSEAMVPGIRRALEQAAKEHGRPDLVRVPITAVDGLVRYKEEIDQGRLAATVEMPSRVSAAIDLLASFWSDNSVPADPIVLLPVSSYPSLETLAQQAAKGKLS
jgi:ABC-type sugar transport system substrate-binding protein